jgi:hypothetical protein
MPDPEDKPSLPDLLNEQTRLDKMIAADLSAEIEGLLAEKVGTIPQMRRFLAIKGYRELRQRLAVDVGGKSGEAALRALASSLRAFARDRPGLSAATFRSAVMDSPEWRSEGEALGRFILNVLAGIGLTGDPAHHALRTLRALVRGFVIHELTSSFLDVVDYDESYDFAVDVYIAGLKAIAVGNGGGA